jgi:hypothetical protein
MYLSKEAAMSRILEIAVVLMASAVWTPPAEGAPLLRSDARAVDRAAEARRGGSAFTASSETQ